MQTPAVPRRSVLKALAGVAALGFTEKARAAERRSESTGADAGRYRVTNDRIHQSVVAWCFNPMRVPELARHAATLGLKSVELCDPQFWPALKELGLTCAISGSHGFTKGFAHVEEHAECLAVLRDRIEACAAAGVGRVITFSGFRRGLGEDEGMKNMVDGLKQIVGLAERRKVTLCLEMLNSRVNQTMKGHPDYFCDDIGRTIEVCRRVGSPRLKLLFDIYHVQIMHGDLIRLLKQHAAYIGHVHTAGVPGRNEIDETQEINYPALMRTLLELGYEGYVGQEFIPTWPDKIASLAQGVRICDV